MLRTLISELEEFVALHNALVEARCFGPANSADPATPPLTLDAAAIKVRAERRSQSTIKWLRAL